MRAPRLFFSAVLCALMMAGRCYADGPFPFKGEVNEPDVNVRADSTVSGGLICTLKKGERVKVVSEAYDWYKINLPRGATAFVHKDFLLVSSDNQGRSSGKVLKDKVNVRLRPDRSAPILGQVDKGAVVDVYRSTGDWIKIVPPEGTTGWVNKNFINRVSPDAPEPPTPAVASKPAPGLQENLVTEGFLKRKVFTRVAPYKLISDDGGLYLISGETKALDEAVNKRVRVTGMVNDPSQQPPIITVETIEIIK